MITLLTLGKLKGRFSYLLEGEAEYLKRLQAYAPTSLIELPDETITSTCTPEVALQREAERLQPYIDAANLTIALSERGQQWSSTQLAKQLANWQERAGLDPQTNPSGGASPPSNRKRASKGSHTAPRSGILFLVGSSHGLAESALQQATVCWSLSQLTYPHPMVRLLVLEQLYRAFTIQRGLPYHK